jgi:antitoxin MazE
MSVRDSEDKATNFNNLGDRASRSICGYNVITIIHSSMAVSVKGRIIKVGNSQGIRIPKLLLEQSGIQANVTIEVRDRQIVIAAASGVRSGWEEAFAQMADNDDEDIVLDNITATVWDEAEWEW